MNWNKIREFSESQIGKTPLELIGSIYFDCPDKEFQRISCTK